MNEIMFNGTVYGQAATTFDTVDALKAAVDMAQNYQAITCVVGADVASYLTNEAVSLRATCIIWKYNDGIDYVLIVCSRGRTYTGRTNADMTRFQYLYTYTGTSAL